MWDLVRPQLKYCVQFWLSRVKKDAKEQESTQGQMVKKMWISLNPLLQKARHISNIFRVQKKKQI